MMMGSRFYLICLVVLCATGLAVPTQCLGRICLPEEHVALFIFGDSIIDAGNNNYINTTTVLQANVWPYGESYFKYPSGRASDGRLIPDFIAEYLKLPFIPPYLHPGYHRYTDGANFASAGAGALVETRRGLVIDLHTQFHYFEQMERVLRQKLGEAETRTLLSRAVYLISIGTNDYLVTFANSSTLQYSYSREEYVDMVIGNMTTVIKEIHKKGGRKFAFLNVEPVGCVPLAKAIKPEIGGACMEELTALVKLHNKALSHVLQILETQLKGFKYSHADLYTFVTERINDPLKYGFKEGKKGCCGSGSYRENLNCGKGTLTEEYELCGNPSEYVFFDAVHPTEKAYQQLAKLMWDGDLNVTWPYGIKALVAGHK
ncbi:GDSL esterase/lipase 1-like [Juglans regia]|uniref:GDSL esterase/lipase 1-like n=2 Tax=Juglans regia TaxID=51240 RepID=A0A2I4G5K6_JUGRE|nr:GDSL esterase/lipase 1-like [Juglans regia]